VSDATPPLRRRWSAPLAAALLGLASVSAQPYAADGGFDRPREALATQQRPAIALALDGGSAHLASVEGDRVVVAPVVAGQGVDMTAAVTVMTGAPFRDVFAGSAPHGTASAVYGAYHRDAATGSYEYRWHAAGETRPLLSSPQVIELRLVVGADGPEAWVVRPTPAGGVVERYRWTSGRPDPEVVLTSALSLAAIDVAYDTDGHAHLSFLEGFSQPGDFGTVTEWTAWYLADALADAPRPTRLGDALGPQGGTVVGADDGVLVLWTRVDGMVVQHDPRGEAAVLGPGRPVAATPASVVWREGATMWVQARPLRTGEAVPAAWSPVTIERGTAVVDAAGVTHLAWTGPAVGSGFSGYVSDDASPMQRTLSDRIAAALGWAPWRVGEEALGQALGALLVALLASVAALPVFALLASLLARRLAPGAIVPAGPLLGGATIVAGQAAVLAAIRLPAAAAWGLLGLPWTAPVALALGLLAGARLVRRVDLEPVPAMVVGAVTSFFVGVGVLAFVTFQHWLDLFGV
jgi:hypothetical protein